MMTLILSEIASIIFACGLLAIFFLAKERRMKKAHEKKMEQIKDEFVKKCEEMFNDGWQDGWDANSPGSGRGNP